jgi:hypothetical protein
VNPKVTFLEDEDEEDEESDEDEEFDKDEDMPVEDAELEIPEKRNVDSDIKDDADTEDDAEPPKIAGVETIEKRGVSESDNTEAEMDMKYGPRKHNRHYEAENRQATLDDMILTISTQTWPNSNSHWGRFS